MAMAAPISSSSLSPSISSATSSSSSIFMGSALNFKSFAPSPTGRNPQKLLLVAKKISGLEEAMKIRREREQQQAVKSKRRLPLRRGRVSPRLPVPDHILKPPYVETLSLPELSKEHQFHDSEGIAKMRAACQLATRVLDYAGTLVRVSYCQFYTIQWLILEFLNIWALVQVFLVFLMLICRKVFAFLFSHL
ncbi:hypothetical protein QQ045_025329 [Rhodiola kirilowii]